MKTDLKKFIEAQETDYEVALSEIKSGRKRSHWMWYIFPQFYGLGFSETSKYYAIKTITEAREYLNHPVLGNRLKEITNELLKLERKNPRLIFGSPDDLKLKSSMTLFSVAANSEKNIFKEVIEKYFNNELDSKTLDLIKANS